MGSSNDFSTRSSSCTHTRTSIATCSRTSLCTRFTTCIFSVCIKVRSITVFGPRAHWMEEYQTTWNKKLRSITLIVIMNHQNEPINKTLQLYLFYSPSSPVLFFEVQFNID